MKNKNQFLKEKITIQKGSGEEKLQDEILQLKDSEESMEAGEKCGCHYKQTPREEEELKLLKNRLNRIIGQLNGINKMIEDNRYCGDIMIQVAAVESALQSFGYLVLKDHMETCMVEEIKKGNTEIVEEVMELIKKLK